MEIVSLEIKEYTFNKYLPQWELFITFTLFMKEREIFCSAFLEYGLNGWKIDIRELQKIGSFPKKLKTSILNHEKILAFKKDIIDKNEESAEKPVISNIKEKFRYETMVVCHYTMMRFGKEEKIRSIIERIDEKWYVTCYFKEELPHYYQIEKNFLGFDEYVFTEIKKDKKMRIRFLF